MTQTENQPKILVVDDVPGNIRILSEMLRDDYQIFMATSGWDALETASTERPDLILLDVVMPDLDGYAVCERLKAHGDTKSIPVVFVTSNTQPEQIVRGIAAGAFYYLTKPVDTKMLLAIVKAALSDRARPCALEMDTSHDKDILSLMVEGKYKIKTLDEALQLSCVLSKLCPEPERTFFGLMELMTNAVEHGSLGITYEEKASLSKDNQWRDEVERRLSLPEYRNKQVIVRLQRVQNEIHFLIKDEGPGFNWQSYLSFDPGRAFDPNGRGIAMAKSMYFDFLEYRGVGNEVLAAIKTAI